MFENTRVIDIYNWQVKSFDYLILIIYDPLGKILIEVSMKYGIEIKFPGNIKMHLEPSNLYLQLFWRSHTVNSSAFNRKVFPS